MPTTTPDRTLGEGRFLRLIDRGGWEFAVRRRGTGVVGILAVTADDQVILVEQHRPAVDAAVVELPAGLVGDEDDSAEHQSVAAGRELEEETGYRAADLRPLATGASSAGLTSECVTLYHATGLTRVGTGGGVAGEDIAVHHVPLADVRPFLAAAQAAGKAIDFKIAAALYLAGYA